MILNSHLAAGDTKKIDQKLHVAMQLSKKNPKNNKKQNNAVM